MSLRVSHHLLLCATASKAACCNPDIGKASWTRLKAMVKELDLEDVERPQGVVLRSKVDCLRICSDGPILLIWPDGIWYGGVTPERTESIVREHVFGGQPIEDWIIRRTPFQ
ncbi:MAG TPA: (2Fe-2S) ferredoxin domain-containing protein [Prochlorococcus sp.]|jgi:(2Fe-2S) ferredoxin|tara:strand:+ start:228 stop:563 length:336 start_codon:yes stop_codon:yes gene_type:complete